MQFPPHLPDGAPAYGVRGRVRARVKSNGAPLSNCTLFHHTSALKTASWLMSVSTPDQLLKFTGARQEPPALRSMARKGLDPYSLPYPLRFAGFAGKGPGQVFESTRKWRSSFARWETREIIATKNTKTPSFLMKLALLGRLFGTLKRGKSPLQAPEASYRTEGKNPGLGARKSPLGLGTAPGKKSLPFSLLDAFLPPEEGIQQWKAQQQQLTPLMI
ncbi:hypothetical protein GWK47_045908 [Chionoecetes opilio]|uniref:Uncharacterized protein n=1 Tax=Chionoecetes opilio TaxID=41210 RepID=A0A8J4Y565_CHIOP|nr:hypothetical protein GWK47_045908 [Chionoecetes opilio]